MKDLISSFYHTFTLKLITVLSCVLTTLSMFILHANYKISALFIGSCILLLAFCWIVTAFHIVQNASSQAKPKWIIFMLILPFIAPIFYHLKDSPH
ncbi:PLDc N-terminal domain-containing protein [Persicobacter psychrovividus]|uniref:PLDc N-terminal domain-containing protein n=1 Tax=Persicobacter psychrovividus TaxID=387638 RepID=UPI003BA9440C